MPGASQSLSRVAVVTLVTITWTPRYPPQRTQTPANRAWLKLLFISDLFNYKQQTRKTQRERERGRGREGERERERDGGTERIHVLETSLNRKRKKKKEKKVQVDQDRRRNERTNGMLMIFFWGGCPYKQHNINTRNITYITYIQSLNCKFFQLLREWRYRLVFWALFAWNTNDENIIIRIIIKI